MRERERERERERYGRVVSDACVGQRETRNTVSSCKPKELRVVVVALLCHLSLPFADLTDL